MWPVAGRQPLQFDKQRSNMPVAAPLQFSTRRKTCPWLDDSLYSLINNDQTVRGSAWARVVYETRWQLRRLQLTASSPSFHRKLQMLASSASYARVEPGSGHNKFYESLLRCNITVPHKNKTT